MIPFVFDFISENWVMFRVTLFSDIEKTLEEDNNIEKITEKRG